MNWRERMSNNARTGQLLAINGGEPCIEAKLPHWHWPTTTEDDVEAVINEMKHGKKNLSGYSEAVSVFEKNFAEYHDIQFALLMNSGTSSIYAALWAVGIRQGDEVIAPVLTFFSTATPIKHLNATPIFCDCLLETGCIDPEEIKKNITKRTKAVIITHLYGHPCDIEEITDICSENNLFLIEDCSHAHGATYKGKKVGTFGDLACFSLDSQKMLAAGEAGIMITKDRLLYERALVMCDYGPRLRNELTFEETKKFVDTGLGLKYRANSLAAALVNSRFKRLNSMIDERNRALRYLEDGLKGIPGIRPPVTRKCTTRGAYYGFKPFYVSGELGGLKRNEYINILKAEGMDIRTTGTPPLHLLPIFNDNYKKGDFPVSEEFYDSTVSLPTFSFDSDKRVIDEYITAFRKVANACCSTPMV